MRRMLLLAGVLEIATGLALLVVPSFVGRVLLGEGLDGVAVSVGRVTGIALVGLGVACWPGTPMMGMSIYSGGVAAYLAYLGLASGRGGILLWPAVGAHAILTVLLIAASRGSERTRT